MMSSIAPPSVNSQSLPASPDAAGKTQSPYGQLSFSDLLESNSEYQSQEAYFALQNVPGNQPPQTNLPSLTGDSPGGVKSKSDEDDSLPEGDSVIDQDSAATQQAAAGIAAVTSGPTQGPSGGADSASPDGQTREKADGTSKPTQAKAAAQTGTDDLDIPATLRALDKADLTAKPGSDAQAGTNNLDIPATLRALDKADLTAKPGSAKPQSGSSQSNELGLGMSAIPSTHTIGEQVISTETPVHTGSLLQVAHELATVERYELPSIKGEFNNQAAIISGAEAKVLTAEGGNLMGSSALRQTEAGVHAQASGLVQNVINSLPRPLAPMHIELQPEGFGSVHLYISPSRAGADMRLDIRTMDSAAHSLLVQNLGELRDALKTDRVTIQVQPTATWVRAEQPSFGAQNQEAQYQGGNRQQRQEPHEPERQSHQQTQPGFEELVNEE